MLRILDSGGVLLECADPWEVSFTNRALQISRGGKVLAQHRWTDISDMRIVPAALGGRSWSILQGVLEWLAPVSLASRDTRIEIERPESGWHFYEVPKSTEGVRKYDRFVSECVDALAETGALHLLGDAGFMRGAIAMAELPRRARRRQFLELLRQTAG